MIKISHKYVLFQIHLSNVICDGSEHSILECKHDDWGVTGSCEHKDDAGVRCIRAGVCLEIVTKLPKSTSCVTAEKVVDSQFFFVYFYQRAHLVLLNESHWTTPSPNLRHRHRHIQEHSNFSWTILFKEERRNEVNPM